MRHRDSSEMNIGDEDEEYRQDGRRRERVHRLKDPRGECREGRIGAGPSMRRMSVREQRWYRVLSDALCSDAISPQRAFFVPPGG